MWNNRIFSGEGSEGNSHLLFLLPSPFLCLIIRRLIPLVTGEGKMCKKTLLFLYQKNVL